MIEVFIGLVIVLVVLALLADRSERGRSAMFAVWALMVGSGVWVMAEWLAR